MARTFYPDRTAGQQSGEFWWAPYRLVRDSATKMHGLVCPLILAPGRQTIPQVVEQLLKAKPNKIEAWVCT